MFDLTCWVPPALHRARSPPKSLPAGRFSTCNSLAGFTRKLTRCEDGVHLAGVSPETRDGLGRLNSLREDVSQAS
jgi:hypothetical protein